MFHPTTNCDVGRYEQLRYPPIRISTLTYDDRNGLLVAIVTLRIHCLGAGDCEIETNLLLQAISSPALHITLRLPTTLWA